MNIKRNMSRISFQQLGKNNDLLKFYSQNKKVTIVYPAHVIVNFVTSLMFLFVLK